MQKPISRRRFLKGAAVSGGVALLGLPQDVSAGAGRLKDSHLLLEPRSFTAEDLTKAYAQQDEYDTIVLQPVYKTRIDAHWFDNGTRFWYRNDLPEGRREFILVDAGKGARTAAFDHVRLAEALTTSTGTAVKADHLPISELEFTDGGRNLHFKASDKWWQCDLSTYSITSGTPGNAEPAPEPRHRRGAPDEGDKPHDSDGTASPDGKWIAFIKDANLFVRGKDGGDAKALTTAGTAEHPFGEIAWSPDSETIVAYHIDPVEVKPVYMVESSPADGGTRGVLHQHEYLQPGEPMSRFAMWTFNRQSGAAAPVEGEPIDFGDAPELRWSEDNHSFLYSRPDRGHQSYRVIAVDAATGKTRDIVHEKVDGVETKFINTSNVYQYFTKGAAEVIYVSEMDGWRHLYLYDTATGTLKKQLTQGEWVVRTVDKVDEDARQIWFQGSGKNAGEDPYHNHHYRVNFDGTGLVALTDGNGTHDIAYSPNRDYIIDTYSRADMPPVHNLRRTSDGSLACPLETADIEALLKRGWRSPEVFTAKARDGKTDIWGVVFRPTHFDRRKKYPIIENIYAGPQDSFTRKSFSVRDSMQSLAELGFIVVQCDGMGTRNRSKAFHDVCWQNIKDAGFPDRIAWMTALAAKYPYVDTSRVGVYGTSAGGQNATGALLFHPDFYKVGVSSCGCHDNRIDKQWWNEQWMGYPLGPWYADNSNITHAANLRGKLLLMVGELDSNVPPESTIRLTDALMKADKDFELIVLTGQDHTGGGVYGDRRRVDFFVRNLLGVEPPDRNAPKPRLASIDLRPHRSADEHVTSLSGGRDTTILFRNATPAEVDLFWINEAGDRVPYGSIPPGGQHEQHTYSGHAWLIVNKDGKPLGLYVGDIRPGIATLR